MNQLAKTSKDLRKDIGLKLQEGVDEKRYWTIYVTEFIVKLVENI